MSGFADKACDKLSADANLRRMDKRDDKERRAKSSETPLVLAPKRFFWQSGGTK